MVLYGASGHCKVIIDICENCNLAIKAIVDDNPKSKVILGREVLKSDTINLKIEDCLLISIGNNKVRKLLSNQLKVNFLKLIHPRAVISNYSNIGEGTVVMAGVVVNPEVTIGKHCIINTSSIVEHDCKIYDFVHISPNVSLAGGVIIGEGTHVGIGVSVIQGVKIGKWATIGAGAVIIRDVPDFAVIVGNPGKIIKFNQENE
ncbi:acetyltransferase [Flavobacterium sp. SUN046]|nr:acetyltransferase [Flavobacterium sp. SUN046]MEC4050892.1 acetyltransferase [Flavobacterium sp. SUN046]